MIATMNGNELEILLGVGFMVSGAGMILSNLLLDHDLRRDDPAISPVMSHSGPILSILYLRNRPRFRSRKRDVLCAACIVSTAVWIPLTVWLLMTRD